MLNILLFHNSFKSSWHMINMYVLLQTSWPDWYNLHRLLYCMDDPVLRQRQVAVLCQPGNPPAFVLGSRLRDATLLPWNGRSRSSSATRAYKLLLEFRMALVLWEVVVASLVERSSIFIESLFGSHCGIFQQNLLKIYEYYINCFLV